MVSSGRARASIYDRPDVLATQRRSEPAGNESVHDLHALDVPRARHDLEERGTEWQRARELASRVRHEGTSFRFPTVQATPRESGYCIDCALALSIHALDRTRNAR